MPDKQIALDLAAFLDSAEAAALAAPARPDVRRIAEAFVSICYEELGKQPHRLDGQDVEVVMRRGMPGRLKPRDPVAEHVPAVLEAFFAHLETAFPVTTAFEMRHALAATSDAFLATVRSGENASVQAPAKPQKPFVHGAQKLSRNDPCSCGSGKKYKKCHGKNA